MPGLDVQAVTLVEAVVLLLTNGAGALLALLAWRVSDTDVREAVAWDPPTDDPVEWLRLRHNRLVVTEDQRHGEAGRLACHGLVALVGVFWLLTPQPVNPMVVWWAVAVRAAVVLLSLVLIEKTARHLVARWRFNKPWATSTRRLGQLWPAIRLAWADVRALLPGQERNR